MLLNDTEYAIKLAYLEANDPLNFMIHKLRDGNNALNAMYLMEELRNMPKTEPKRKDEKPQSTNVIAQGYEVQLRHLRQSRDQLSNDFHLCVTDADRAKISSRIKELTAEIVALNDRLNSYVNGQEITEEPKSDKYPIPEDGLSLARLQHQIRNKVNRINKAIERIFQRNPEDPQLRTYETKLREAKLYKLYIDQAIKKREHA